MDSAKFIELRSPIVTGPHYSANRGIDIEPDPGIKPFRIADDCWYVGRMDVGVIVVKSDKGLLLFDAMDPEDAATRYIMPQLIELGLDGEKILANILTHGHFDHFGGAKELHDLTGCPVLLHKDDETAMDRPDYHYNNQKHIHAAIDQYLNDGDTLAYGDKTVYCCLTDGHSPGCMSFVVPVKDNGKEHMLCILGGMGLPPHYRDCTNYLASVIKYAKFCKKLNGDMFISPHVYNNQGLEKAEKMFARKSGEPNPFVIGVDGVQEVLYQRGAAALKHIAEKYVNNI